MLTWVVGAGGLLGSSVQAALRARGGRAVFEPAEPLPWREPEGLAAAMAFELDRFLAQAVARGHRSWAVVWCAGAAVVASPAREVAQDVAAWEMFLRRLHEALAGHPAAERVPGCLVLASSAGGVWGGHLGPPIAESTPVKPISEYGCGHLAREQALQEFAAQGAGVCAAVVRLSNLYGPGQRLDKPQGLISHVSRSVIQRRPILIYVSLDTVRDYLYAPDAGRAIDEVLDRLDGVHGGGVPTLKILASEEEVSIAGLLALFRRVTRRQVAVTAGLRPFEKLQPLHLRFRSTVWTGLGRSRTPLHHGIALVFRRQLEQYHAGTLPVPPAA